MTITLQAVNELIQSLESAGELSIREQKFLKLAKAYQQLGVEMFALMFAEEAIKDNNITTGWKARASRAASEYAELLREGADK